MGKVADHTDIYQQNFKKNFRTKNVCEFKSY